jgi:hypothetical protein
MTDTPSHWPVEELA